MSNNKLLDKYSDSNFDIISFPDKGEDGHIYNFSFVFYKNEEVEIYVRRPLEKEYDKHNLYDILNEFNAEYRNTSCFIDDEVLNVKTDLRNSDLKDMLEAMISSLKLASKIYQRI